MKIILRKIGADATITFRIITTLAECGDKTGGKVLCKYTVGWIVGKYKNILFELYITILSF